MKTVFLSMFMLTLLSVHAQIESLEWAKTYNNPAFSYSSGLELDSQNNVYLAGRFEGSLDMDPGPANLIFNSSFSNKDFFLQKLDPQGNLLWAKNIIPDDSISPRYHLSITSAADGDIFLSAKFRGRLDFDPGPDSQFVSSFNMTHDDYFFLSLDSLGNFSNVFSLSGASEKQIYSLTQASSGEIIMAGDFKGTIDLDPGPGTFNDTSLNRSKDFVQKLDANANLLWARFFESDSFVTVNSLEVDAQGNIFCVGTYNGMTDFDPGSGNYILNSPNDGWSMFSLKMDSQGNILWLLNLEPSIAGAARHTVLDEFGNLYSTGLFAGTADFDPGPNQRLLTSASNGSSLSGYLQKFDPQGNLVWAYPFENQPRGFMEIIYLKIDQNGLLYMGGHINGEVDIDPGPNVEIVGFADTTGNYIGKFSPDGDFIWSESFLTNPNYTEIWDIEFDSENDIYATGNFIAPFDLDPGPGTFTLNANGPEPDFYVAKFKQDECSDFFLVIDSLRELSCTNSAYIALHAEGGSEPISYLWNTNPPVIDSFISISQRGFYEIRASDSFGCERSANYLIEGPDSSQTAVWEVNVLTTPLRPGFPAHIWLDASNRSCTPFSGELRVLVDSLLILDNPMPDTTIGDTLIWYIDSLNYDSSNVMIRLDAAVSLQAMIGQQACVYLELIGNYGGLDSLIYQENLCRNIINGFDPNDIQVNPQGACEEGYILNDQLLTYKVRFQNTGNADAINIFILDSLDVNLDLSTIKVIGQSHKPMITELQEGGILKFSFDNIHLPSTAMSEPLSHGYVIYQVMPKPNLPSGTEIRNRAGIYFDFNEAVITNTVLNTVTDQIPVYDPTISQMSSTLISNQLPNSAITYQWIDCSDGSEIAGANQQSFVPSTNGTYAVVIREGGCETTSDCFTITNVGLDEIFQSQIEYYPNPVEDRLHIDLGEMFSTIQISIFNVNGQLISQEKLRNQAQMEVEMPDEKGMYFVQIMADTKQAQLKIFKK